MKACKGSAFWASTTDADEWSVLASPDTHWGGGWVGPSSDLVVVTYRSNPIFSRIRTLAVSGHTVWTNPCRWRVHCTGTQSLIRNSEKPKVFSWRSSAHQISRLGQTCPDATRSQPTPRRCVASRRSKLGVELHPASCVSRVSALLRQSVSKV
jgi:hypothetical protein